nr:hypothetical protein [Tanacetum cinerariifolium]
PAESYFNHGPELVVSVVDETIQDAERIVQLVDHLHLHQTSDGRALPSERIGAWLVVVIVAMVEGVIVGAVIGRGATVVGVCTSNCDVVLKIDSIPTSNVGLSMLITNCDDTDELCC